MRQRYVLQEMTGLQDMVAQYPLVRQLNPDLTRGEYEERLSEMIPNGYAQVGAFHEKTCIGLSGFWINTKLYCGRYIEMDNVVVDVAHRSQGIGKLLADWIVENGRKTGCQVAILDAYVHNKAAHRFYFREGYTILGFHMLRDLRAPDEPSGTSEKGRA